MSGRWDVENIVAVRGAGTKVVVVKISVWCNVVCFNKRTLDAKEIKVHFDRGKPDDDKCNHDEELRCEFQCAAVVAPFRDEIPN
jgi:hypothetical protein